MQLLQHFIIDSVDHYCSLMMDDLDALYQTASSVLVHNTLSNSLRFLIPFLLKAHLERGRRLVFIAAENLAQHYERICRRMGCPFITYLESGQLTIMDLLNPSQAQPDHKLATSWEALVLKLRQNVESVNSGMELVIVLDSLSTLFALSETPNCVFSFCLYCLNLTSDSTFITSINRDVNSPLCNSLYHYFDFVCNPQPLNLLSIANVDGLLQVNRIQSTNNANPQVQQNEEMVLSWNLFFRLKETGIVFFRSISPDL